MKPRIAIPEPCSYDRDYSSRALPFYLQAVEQSGGEPVLIPLDLAPEEIARQITNCCAVLLPGSRADIDPQKYGAPPHARNAAPDPLRDAADELLLQDAYNMRKPVFGICYGLQSLNVWRTGTLLQHIETSVNHSPVNKVEPTHEVKIEPDSHLAQEIGAAKLAVNSSHHQAADIAGDALRIVARSSDDGVVEAVEGTSPGHYVVAVQWHPERNFDQDKSSQNLFRSFVEAARRWNPESK